MVESNGRPYGEEGEAFLSVNREGVYVRVVSVNKDKRGGEIIRAAGEKDFVSSARLCLVSRDYGMFDRSEAPQTFAPLKTAGGAAR